MFVILSHFYFILFGIQFSIFDIIKYNVGGYKMSRRSELMAKAVDICNNRYKNSMSVYSDKEIKQVMKDLYYLNIAKQVLALSTCLRRNYGAVIVKDDRIVSCGYNGAPAGEKNCSDIGYCAREAMGVPSGQRYELCVACHAEENSIINASKEEMKGATIYIAGENFDGTPANPQPCLMCRKMIKNSGIVRVVGLVNDEPMDLDVSEPPRVKV